MLSITDAQLQAWLASLIWPLTRILGMFMTAPVIGNLRVPARVKIGLALVVTAAVAPGITALPPVDPGSAQGMLILVREMLIGAALGFAMRLAFSAAELAGELAGLQMGLGFAIFYDPQSAGHSGVLSQFMGLLATLVFVAINGHLLMISVLAETFRSMPAGPPGIGMPNAEALVSAASQIFAAGLMMALPVIVTLLVVNFALGVLARAAPQLNIFAIGFPITLGIGFSVLVLALPLFAPVMERLMFDALGLMQQIATPSRRI